MVRMIMFLICTVFAVQGALAQESNPRLARVQVDASFFDSGLFTYLKPRFTLKTQIRLERVLDGQADLMIVPGADTGIAFAQRDNTVWSVVATSHPGAQKFADWLTGQVGQTTITSFVPQTGSPFEVPTIDAAPVIDVVFQGDAARGYAAAKQKCARCHVVDNNRMNAIGSTPSFFVLRTFEDWALRMSGFYTLNPHPAFTIVEDVTDPFDPTRPSPIVPIIVTLDDIENIATYMQTLTPADLGAEIQHQ